MKFLWKLKRNFWGGESWGVESRDVESGGGGGQVARRSEVFVKIQKTNLGGGGRVGGG